MAVPSSGLIRMSGIRNELENNNYAGVYTENSTSLTQASTGVYSSINVGGNEAANRPNGSTPHAMSEFYSYDHDATSLTSFSSSSVQSAAKAVCNASLNQTYYHDGSSTLPVVNDNVYSNSSGTTALSDGYYRFAANGAKFFYVEDEQVSSVANC
tara:strand:- start:396 stop:860 length:465 start_codon:yes stop_codon:yes gene_type:complete